MVKCGRGKFYHNLLWAFLLVIQITRTAGSGHLYVGLLGYRNPREDFCCDTEASNGTCVDYCNVHLIFEVEVQGLHGSSNITTKRPSDRPLSLMEAEQFQTYGITNPLSFPFVRWPGEVNVTVTAYNESYPDQLVNRFQGSFVRHGPMNYYIIRSLNSSGPSEQTTAQLQIVFRYVCDVSLRYSCFTDCIEHPENETCPTTLPSVTEVTFTGFTDPKCEQRDKDGNLVRSSNCSDILLTSPAVPTTRPFKIPTTPAPTTSTIASTTPTSIPTSKSTHVKYLDSGSPTPHSKTQAPSPTTTTTTTKTTSPTTTVPTAQQPGDLSTRIHSSSPGGTTVRGTTGYTPVEYIADDEMAIWPAIVGGILGGVALLSAIGYLLYYRRQKKLQKRQEIYNVNPKILRNFEEYAMNGTSGRADVPLETEQY